MADLKFTLDDGSEYLSHHGVVGMHWGEWNEETQRRYANDGQEHLRRGQEFANTLNEHAANQATMLEGGAYKEGTKHPVEAMLSNVAAAVGHNVNNLLKAAGRVLSDVSSAAVNAGKDILDGIFGTHSGPSERAKAAGYDSHARNQANMNEQMNRDSFATGRNQLESTINTARGIASSYDKHARNQATTRRW